MIYAMSDIHGCLKELQKQMDFLNQISGTGSLETINKKAVQMILSNHEKLIYWIQQMSSYFETESYHDVFYDGESHYYIDGSVYKGGKLLLLAYDEEIVYMMI